MSSKETLEQFGSCWEGLEDPRSGNASLRDYQELLMIALCCVLYGCVYMSSGSHSMTITRSTGSRTRPNRQMNLCSTADGGS
jgi:hypothetical protein